MSTNHPNLGVIFHPTFPPETLADYAQRAEAAGFDELWLWDDCFLPGAFTSATIALAATKRIKVGIGLLPATVYNPLFAAMEITTLTRAFPGRILPGFGHGFGPWMQQIGAAPISALKATEETVIAVHKILAGENVTFHGSQVHLDQVQMQLIADYIPPLYVGAMRKKTLQLAGRVGDGTILVCMSSPAYIEWAWQQIRIGMAESERREHTLAVFMDVKITRDGTTARNAIRQAFAKRRPWVDAQLETSGVTAEAAALVQRYGSDIAEHIPDQWLDLFTASGSPEQALRAIEQITAAGATSIVFQPLDGDPDCLDEYIQYLMPHLRPKYSNAI